LNKCPGLKCALAQVNTSGGDNVDAEMIAARIKEWQRTRLGRMSLGCTVLRNGKPLEGATVKFVPEKFLGPNMKVATGKTNGDGVARPSIALDRNNVRDLPGVPRDSTVSEITKDGETIPAKYNSETTLGQEVALDAVGIQEGIRFDLKY